jgi:glutamyl/glutaminyl-tRNA synthetase
VVKGAACFDYAKLQWLNGHYIREADEERIFQLCLEYLWDADAINAEFMREGGPALRRMVMTVQSNLKTISEVGDQLTYFLGEVHHYDPQGLEKFLIPETVPVLQEAVFALQETVDFTAITLEERFRQLAVQKGRKFAEYVHPMRLSITGKTNSPNLFELIQILGQGRCVVRLMRFIQMIKHSQKTEIERSPDEVG